MHQPQAASKRNADTLTPGAAIKAAFSLLPFALPGFRIGERIHQSARAIIHRAVRESDAKPVILKVLAERALTSENIAHYRHEFEILQRIKSTGVIRPLDLKLGHSLVALVVEDFGAISLKQVIDSRANELTLEQRLHIALQLVASLRDVHAAHVIHKDINPNNIVINLDTSELKLIDFGLATLLSIEHVATAIPTLLQGTLLYIAPEQTGRMNRAVDYRSDFYSLGATLYELFTGQPPFAATDPMEIVHAHIARQPAPPHHVNPAVPEPVSAIILKLLAKTAEARYQSSFSLEADLEECLRQYKETGDVTPFPIDRLQVNDHFRLPQKLYGRDADLQALLAAFDRASTGKPEALFVTGQSGIGKSSLVREVYKPITAKRGYFAAGKFDQFQRNVPYSAIVNALGELIRQLLSESEANIEAWRQHLQDALGSNGRVLTEIIPEVELIIGEQPPVPSLGPVETQERLAVVMRKFFVAVCQSDHPLALYLDDIQWADSASLGLLTQVLGDPDLQFFLLIAAYRDNEVDTDHPVLLAREKLHRDGVAATDIRLAPHEARHVEQIIVDTLSTTREKAAPLALLVHEKTGGNPFFVEEFLKSLHTKGLLKFDGQRRCWRWTLDDIQAEAVTDNVVELLAQNIRELPENAQHLLRLAACLGNVFDTRTLGLGAELPAGQAAAGLHQAIMKGFIHPLDDGYLASGMNQANDYRSFRFRFAHDRVQQAVYELIPEEQRKQVHYRLGQLLLAGASSSEIERERFQIVNHLNAGREHANTSEKIDLADLNLTAGRQARASAVYETALRYFRTGIELLGEHGWNEHYTLALALHSEAGQAAPLVGDTAELDRQLQAVRENARLASDKMPLYEAKIETEVRNANFKAAAEAGLDALAELGVPLPKPNGFHVFYYKFRARLALWWHTPESLLNHRRMTDPARLVESRLLRLLCHVFYYWNHAYSVIALYRVLYVCVKHGISNATPSIFASYGVSLCYRGNIEKGYRFGQLALALVDKIGATAQRPYVLYQVTTLLSHWKQPAREAVVRELEAHRAAVDIGDLETAGLAVGIHGYMLFHAGELLPSLHNILTGHIQTLSKTLNDTKTRVLMGIYRDTVDYMMNVGEPNERFCVKGEAGEKAETAHPFTLHFFNAFVAIHFGDTELAYRETQLFRKCAYTVIGAMHFYELYEGLAHIDIHHTLDIEKQKKNREVIVQATNQLRLFAKHCPDNYRHRWCLLEAEFARLEGNNSRAEEYYDDAIAAAKATGHIHEEALANELAARYYLVDPKKIRIAQAYMQEARTLYARWGAKRKVQWLEDNYPQLQLTNNALRDAPTIDRASVTNVTASAMNLDLPALMKALKTIAEENVHSLILQKTIDIVMQFAGAEKALLLLRDAEDKLRIEADMDTARETAELLKGTPAESSTRLSQAVINYTRRTKSSVVIHDAQEPQSVIPGLQNDPYLHQHQVRSILCIPFKVGDGELIGLLYVENNQSTHAFTERRVETLEIICLSVAGRLELSRKAIMDSLTGLYNRAYFQSALHKELSLARRKQRPVSLVMIDIDHFKKINDTYGHQMGDSVLQYVARTIKDSCRESDVVARYGGEEMAVILTETNADQALEVAERIRKSIEKHPFDFAGQQVRATASLGVAANTSKRADPDTLIKAADEALYRSKEKGRNRVTLAE